MSILGEGKNIQFLVQSFTPVCSCTSLHRSLLLNLLSLFLQPFA